MRHEEYTGAACAKATPAIRSYLTLTHFERLVVLNTNDATTPRLSNLITRSSVLPSLNKL